MTATIETKDGIAVIAMNDGKANAINPTMLDSLNAALDTAETEAKAVILTGMPGKFSAGFDLKYFQSASPDDAAALVNNGGRLALRLFGLRKPLIGAISGHAIAMGCFITQCCDVRIAMAGDFKTGANETAINMVLPVFAQELLHARLRSDKLTEAGILAKLYGPEEAVEVGYFDRVVSPDDLMPAAMEVATALAALPDGAYAGNKRALRGERLKTIEASLS